MARESFSRYQSYTILKNRRKKFLQLLKIFFIFYLAFLFLTGSFFRTVEVKSTSMEPTIKSGTLVALSPLPIGGDNIPFLFFHLPGWRDPERTEVVEIQPGYHKDQPPWVMIASDLLRFFTLNQVNLDQVTRESWDSTSSIKRVIGIPGDTIRIENSVAFVKPKNQEFFFSEFEIGKKSYQIQKVQLPTDWKEEFPFSSKVQEIILGENEYFLLNDNRNVFSDSRAWGPIHRKNVRSIAVLKYWPWSETGGF